MFPLQLEETVCPKQFALMISSRISLRTGLPEKYAQAIRLMDKHGGYRVTNENKEYKRREMSLSRAKAILAGLEIPPKKGGQK
jgi:hypothetical protein